MKVNIITLGCSKNTVDSENLAGRLSGLGYDVCFDRVRNDCEVVIVNTCGFIGDAKEESVNTLLQQVAVKQRGRKRRLLIAVGCLVERYKYELRKEIPEVDAWFGVHEWQEVVDFVAKNSFKNPHCGFDPQSSSKKVRSAAANGALLQPVSGIEQPIRVQSTPRHYAYLKISEGCNRSCSYCAIPLIRGRHVSRPVEDIVEEAKHLVSSGVRELLIVAQDTTYYGLDLYGERRLALLLDRLASESGADWIRLHYTYPSSFPLDVLDVMNRHGNICKYLDIPLQHINSNILASMRRNINRDETLRLLKTIRQRVPGVVVRTTLIVGYPGETVEMFDELKAFVSQAEFDRLGVFTYSREEQTPAEPLGDTVPDDEKQRRMAEIMELQDAISFEKNKRLIGTTIRTIVDRREGNYYIARSQHDSPEIDNEVLIEHQGEEELKTGAFYEVKVKQAFEHDILGEVDLSQLPRR